MIPAREIVKLFLVALCFASTAWADGFADFRTHVQGKIPAGWQCEEIATFENITRFVVRSADNRYSIVVTRREAISQQEWTLRSERGEKAIAAIIAGAEPEKIDAEALLKAMKLPEGRYEDEAVSVDLSEPELWYAEIGSDEKKSQAVLKVILGTLELYDKSKPADAGNAAKNPESERKTEATPSRPPENGRSK